MSREWRFYLRDMRGFCDRILSVSASLTRTAFNEHDLVYDGIVRNIELLGEAARQIPEEIRILAPDVEWSAIIALRNILVHAYFGVDDDILWDIVRNKIAPLRASLEHLEKHLA